MQRLIFPIFAPISTGNRQIAQNKAVLNKGDVAAFLNAFGNKRCAYETNAVVAKMEKVTGCLHEI